MLAIWWLFILINLCNSLEPYCVCVRVCFVCLCMCRGVFVWGVCVCRVRWLWVLVIEFKALQIQFKCSDTELVSHPQAYVFNF